MGPQEWGMLIILSFLWGGSFFFIRIALSGLPTATVVMLRLSIAAIALAMVVITQGFQLPRQPEQIRALLFLGICNSAIPFALIIWSENYIGSGTASIMNATTPLFGVVLAHFFTHDEKFSVRKIVGVIFGFSGVAIMVFPNLLDQSARTNAVAQLAVLSAAFFYAISGVFGKRLKNLRIEPLVAATGQLIVASCIWIPVGVMIDRPWQIPFPGWPIWLAVLGLALLSTASAYILYFRILQAAGATNVMLVTLLIPVTAILLGIAFLHEDMNTYKWSGISLIGLGLLIIDGRVLSKIR